jgi:hypothetical protein
VKQDAVDLIEGDSWFFVPARSRHHHLLRSCKLES